MSGFRFFTTFTVDTDFWKHEMHGTLARLFPVLNHQANLSQAVVQILDVNFFLSMANSLTKSLSAFKILPEYQAWVQLIPL